MRSKRKSVLSRKQRREFIQQAVPFQKDLYTYALALSRDPDVAKDFVQETYLRALQAYASYQDQNMRAWLFKILKNVFLNWIKRKSAHPTESFSEEHHSHKDSSSYPIPADRWTSDDLRQIFSDEVFTALMRLSTEHREILLLREIENFSYEEIAEILGIPIGTVRSRLHRARQEMFKHLIQIPRFAQQYAQQHDSPPLPDSAHNRALGKIR